MKASVGCDCQRTIKKHMQQTILLPKGLIHINLLSLSAKFSFYANLVLWCVENSTLLKYDNLRYFSDKLFFNIKLLEKYRTLKYKRFITFTKGKSC